MKKLFIASILIFSIPSLAGGIVSLTDKHRVLNLGQINEPSVVVWVSYPGLNGGNCNVQLKLTDELDPQFGNALIPILQQTLLITDEHSPMDRFPIKEDLTIDLKKFVGRFGIFLNIQTSGGTAISSTLHKVLGSGQTLGNPVDLIVELSDCALPKN